MKSEIGTKIKERRLQLGLTQKNLSKDICTQAQISNIEKGELSPSSSVLFKISQKLLVDMNYFFDLEPEKVNEHFNEVKDMIDQLKTQRNYFTLKYVVNNELDEKKYSLSSYEHRYLLWHKGICEYFLSNKFNESIELLQDLIVENGSIDDVLLNINIQTSIAIMYQDEKNYKKSYHLYKIALEQLRENSKINDFYTELKLLFGLSQTLTYLGKYKESKNYCFQAISICVKEKTLYFFPDCYYQLGNNLVKLGDIEEGIKYIKMSRTFYEAQSNTNMVNILNEQLEDLNT